MMSEEVVENVERGLVAWRLFQSKKSSRKCAVLAHIPGIGGSSCCLTARTSHTRTLALELDLKGSKEVSHAVK